MTHKSSSTDNAGETPATRSHMQEPLRQGEDGSSLIEFAVCLGPLMLIMTGIFAFGIAVGNYVILTNACSSGAMQLAISRGTLTSPNYDPCTLAVNSIEAAAPTLTPSNLKFAFVLNGNNFPSTGTPTAGESCTSTSQTTGAAGDLVQGTAITVTVTYPCNLTVYKANNFPTCVMTAKSSELVQ